MKLSKLGNKKYPFQKKFLYSLKKSLSYILGNGAFLYFQKKVFLIFLEMKISGLTNKKFHKVTFWAQKNEQNPALKKFLIFQQMEFSSLKLKKIALK